MSSIHTVFAPAALALAGLLLSGAASAGAIANGGFETGDFAGWFLDSDGFPGSEPDFQVVGVPGNHQARIEIDYPTDLGFFANTLYQPLDLSASPGSELVLTLEWAFTGSDDQDNPDEVFTVALSNPSGGFFGADGLPGSLLDVLSYVDNGSLTAVLDQSFNNAADWVLEVQLNTGGNGFGSYVLLDNISIQARPVPAPGTLFLAGLALLGPLLRRHARA